MILAFQMGLAPDTFWNLTPFEFQCALKGYNNETKRQQQMLAWAQANLMNCWTKRRITPQKLLGAKDLPRSADGIAAYYRAKRKRFGGAG